MRNALKIKDLTLPHRLILAPLCGITLKPFRMLCREYGAGLVFNQMVSAKALVLRDKKTFKILEYDEAEHPIAMQLFGNDPKTLGEAAAILQDLGADVIDLNLGCPARKIINDGGGSILMNDPERLKEIFDQMRKNIRGVFTIKMRAGWDHNHINAPLIAKIAEAHGVDAVTIHGRTRSQGYSGNSDWGIIKTVKESIAIPVIGNGDVFEAIDAEAMMQKTGCDAVMTGRGAFKKPWIFSDFVNDRQNTPTAEELKQMILKLYTSSMAFFGNATGIKNMRKFICTFTKGIKDGAVFRNEMVRINDWAAIKRRLDAFFIMETH
ncbi:MAG: tRNA dihydrouridine synthase DusB [Deltaproteobacteria bacterium]|nr:tRNA dihydrouridine synthase DusB [Deltaproteobacteria bacterium]